MQLFYYPNLHGNSFEFSEEESKHCIKVLRHKVGDTLLLIDGKGQCAEAMIEDAHPKHCSGKVLSITRFEPKRNYALHLFIAPTKQQERIDWMVEKAVEIGVDSIGFIECKRSERGRINLERLHKICISALKQSKQYYLPTLHGPTSFEEAVLKAKAEIKLIAWCPSGTELHLTKQLNKSTQSISICIGPEGDFTEAEAKLAEQNGFKSVSLGPNILRTETAAVYACASIQSFFFS